MKKRISHGNDNGHCLQKIDATDIAEALNSTTVAHAKYLFSENYDSHVQQIGRPDKRLIPVPVGPPLPHRDHNEDVSCYHCLMLTYLVQALV